MVLAGQQRRCLWEDFAVVRAKARAGNSTGLADIMQTDSADTPKPSKKDLDPWKVICSRLFELSSDDVVHEVDRAGLRVNWTVTTEEKYSHATRKRAFRPRVDAAYEQLADDQDRLRVAYIVAQALSQSGHRDELDKRLRQIGWKIESDRLIPLEEDVRELFFPEGTPHDAYVQIRRILQKAKNSVCVVDPYLDGSIFALLRTCSSSKLNVQLLTSRHSSDLGQEARKFQEQHNNVQIDVRLSKEFHDRFVVMDDAECWHIGCSIKDAGNKAFMLSQIEDKQNRDALIRQLTSSWAAAVPLRL